ncbi:chorismate mutase [Chenggangzhangella methanolivorans]|uniref:chorismate mutase n=1 Tax=Chenggangzhangella methanolivorans TaxID=1437009 RepID=A0A9E6UGD7_9HYPH|nr:chorismate mutase [Chenggangzhangella methanolivorans]QZN98622.1 chorismate mutase [Chenggangzhangella methanolivorans]
MTDAQPDTLSEIRREIDRIDEAMHLLLMERGAVIDRLIEIKRTAATGSAFRPQREADMMRRLAARHQGRLPLATAEHLWRTIIATFTHVQSPFTVHVEQGSDALGMHDLARFHLGFDVPLVGHGTPQRVIQAVAGSTGDLGLVRISAEPGSAWWEALGGEGGPQVMARLPFLARGSHPAPAPALVVARPLGEAAASETTVWAIEHESETAPDDGAETLASVKRNGRLLRLAAAHGETPPAEHARRLGGYASPLAA